LGGGKIQPLAISAIWGLVNSQETKKKASLHQKVPREPLRISSLPKEKRGTDCVWGVTQRKKMLGRPKAEESPPPRLKLGGHQYVLRRQECHRPQKARESKLSEAKVTTKIKVGSSLWDTGYAPAGESKTKQKGRSIARKHHWGKGCGHGLRTPIPNKGHFWEKKKWPGYLGRCHAQEDGGERQKSPTSPSTEARAVTRPIAVEGCWEKLVREKTPRTKGDNPDLSAKKALRGKKESIP